MNNEEKRNHECFQMYYKSKLLGFPDKVDLASTSFAYQRIDFNAPLFAKLKNPVSFYCLGGPLADSLLSLKDNLFSRAQIEFALNYTQDGLSKDILILLVLMYLFYDKEWDGKDWVSIPMPLLRAGSFMNQVTSSIAEQIRKEIDEEILKTLVKHFDYSDVKSIEMNKP